MLRSALVIRAAHGTIGEQDCAHTRAIACAEWTLVVRIRIGCNESARAIAPTTFFRGRTSLTCARARRVATCSVDAESRNAIRCCETRSPIRRFLTSAGAIALQDAFIVRVGVARDGSALPVKSTTAFRDGTRHTWRVANVSATNAVHAIIGNALRGRRTRQAIEVHACSSAVAITSRAFIVRVFGGQNQATRAISAAAFFRCATRFACFRASSIATNAIDTLA